MASPTRKLRAGFDALLRNAVTYTKKKDGSTPSIPYFEQSPGSRQHTPFIRYKDCLLSPSDTKDCKGWEAIVTIETITGTESGRGGFDPVDEIESKIISLVTDLPYALDLSPEYSIVGIVFEDSSYDEGLVKMDSSKPNAKPMKVISKETDFRLILSEV